MKFDIIRDAMLPDHPTMGRLLTGDIPELQTLELPWLNNAPETSCIPTGLYRVIVDDSVRFGRPMPHLLDVPGRTGIRIHSGNLPTQTEGCVLVGTARSGETVVNSRRAFILFMGWLIAALRKGDVYAEVMIRE